MTVTVAGADPGFSYRGGAIDHVPVRALRARNQTHFRHAGVQLWGCFNALSCYLSLIFKHEKLDLKNIVDPKLGGARLLRPLDPPLLSGAPI